VRTLVSGDQPAGSYVRIWDGRDDQGRNVASGIYLYQLTSGSFRQVKKLVLMR
jgi:flagellar hook assembly protein FlgD